MMESLETRLAAVEAQLAASKAESGQFEINDALLGPAAAAVPDDRIASFYAVMLVKVMGLVPTERFSKALKEASNSVYADVKQSG